MENTIPKYRIYNIIFLFLCNTLKHGKDLRKTPPRWESTNNCGIIRFKGFYTSIFGLSMDSYMCVK